MWHEIIDKHMILEENMADFSVNTVIANALEPLSIASFRMMNKFGPSTQRVKIMLGFNIFLVQILNIYKYTYGDKTYKLKRKLTP